MGSPAENLEANDAGQVIDIGYEPRKFQTLIHAGMRRFTVVVTHRRFGKTYLTCAQLIDAALRTNKPDARFAYLAPYLKQAKAVAWDYLKQFACAIPGVSVHESELTIRFPNGANITLFGGDNAEALRGGYFDGIVIDEVADLRPDVWGSIIRPALSDRKGWALFIGTPKGINLFHDLYEWATNGFPVAGGGREQDPEWAAMMFRVDETDLIPAKELASAQATMSPAQYRQEFLCDFSASSDDVLIPIDLVTQACQREIVEREVFGSPRIIGVDVARFGDDRSVICKRQGLAAFVPVVMQGIDNMDLAARVAAEINAWQPEAVFVDAGRGEGVIDRLRQLGFSVIEVNFGSRATDDAYLNKRSETWDLMAKWLRDGGSIPNHPELKTDLATPRYSFNSAGKMVLESKDDIKKRGLRSTDVADALALTFAMPVAAKSTSIHARSRHMSEYDPFASMFRRPDRYDRSSNPGDWNPLADMANRALGRLTRPFRNCTASGTRADG
jgi:hypothetical protein